MSNEDNLDPEVQKALEERIEWIDRARVPRADLAQRSIEGTALPDGHQALVNGGGLDSGDVDLTAPIPNTAKIGVWRIELSGHYVLMGLMDDPLATAAAERAPNN